MYLMGPVGSFSLGILQAVQMGFLSLPSSSAPSFTVAVLTWKSGGGQAPDCSSVPVSAWHVSLPLSWAAVLALGHSPPVSAWHICFMNPLWLRQVLSIM